MAKYLVKASYTLEGIKGVKSGGGTARRKAVEKSVKGIGGKLEAFYFGFGDADAYVLVDLPGNVEAAALSVAVCAAGGATTQTVALLTPEEMDQATQQQVGYKPPG